MILLSKKRAESTPSSFNSKILLAGFTNGSRSVKKSIITSESTKTLDAYFLLNSSVNTFL